MPVSCRTLDVRLLPAWYCRPYPLSPKSAETQRPMVSYGDARILQSLNEGRFRNVHDLVEEMPESGHRNQVLTWTSLLSKFSKNGFVDNARKLFDIMPERNIVTYNAMLSAYVNNGRINEAGDFFDTMPYRNVVSWTAMLSGLANAGRINEARRLFLAMPVRNAVSWNVMVNGLIKNGDLEEARRVFDLMPTRTRVSWNLMIEGYSECGRMEEAVALFDEMKDPNVITWTSLISGYCKAGMVEEGYRLFQVMPEKNIVSWTTMICGFARNGFFQEALLLFLEMRGGHGVKPNVETFISLAYACGGIGFPCLGKQLHAHLVVNSSEYGDYNERLCGSLIHMYAVFGFMNYANYLLPRVPDYRIHRSCNSMINGYIQTGQLKKAEDLFKSVPIRDKISCTSMINGYFGAGEVSKAHLLFYNLPEKDAIAWTVMISGFVDNEMFSEAIYSFFEMRANKVTPLNSTFAVLIGAAGSMANLDRGRQLHCLVMKTQSKIDLVLENCLLSMYAKCGEIDQAYIIFLQMKSRDLVSWNSIIMGLSDHGLAYQSLEVFKDMLESRVTPDSVTFLGILSACSHAGLLNCGWEFYKAMSNVYAIQAEPHHSICMINLLAKAGKLEEAENFVLGLPFEPNLAVWGALLGVCTLGEVNLGVALRTAKRVLKLDPLNAPARVALCKINASIGQHVEEQILRMEMGIKRVRKVPARSWLLVGGRVHVFVAGEKSH